MSKFSTVTVPALTALRGGIGEKIESCVNLEQAAQKCADSLFEEFEDSLVLVRVFATSPYGKLPVPNQKFVTDLVASSGTSSSLDDQTLVLSLIGTRGERTTWNSRHDSQGHVGIPLVSGDFVEAIPMMSRLLNELGLGLDWIDSGDTAILAKTLGRMGGVFHVSDAGNAVDQHGRKIIASQDFVSEYGVKTVFGIGGGYMTSSAFAVIVFFTRETFGRDIAELFLPLMSTFKTGTMRLASGEAMFAQ